ncbi:acyltransferase [Flavobacterium sp. LB3R33]|uniref:acyltransferase n=1 Tax=Flavobacterium sp. LB3R33 TaxID=3401721 RepID=UPI003AADE52F
MLKKIIYKFVFIVRKEKLDIGDFSSLDLMKIFSRRLIGLFRGFLFINIPKFKKGFFFVGKHVNMQCIQKIHFSSGTTIGNYVKISSLGSPSFRIGINFSLKDFSRIDSFGSLKKASGKLIIGDNVGISENCYISIRGNLSIGNSVIIGPYVQIFTENHLTEINGIPFRLQDEIRKDVVIGNNVWIGAGSIILAGVTILDNSVIAAGSVVVSNVESESVYGGVPAKLLKKL